MSAFPISSAPVAVGRGFSVEFTLDGGRINSIWSPHLPHGKRRRQVFPAYVAARNAFLNDVARTRRINIAVVDLPVGEAA